MWTALRPQDINMNSKETFKDRTALLFGIPVIIGAVVGIIFLIPINEFVFYYEDKPLWAKRSHMRAISFGIRYWDATR